MPIIDPRITVLLQLIETVNPELLDIDAITNDLIPTLQSGKAALVRLRGAQNDAARLSGITDVASALLALGHLTGVAGAVGSNDEPLNAEQIEQALHEIANDDAKANKVYDNTAGR